MTAGPLRICRVEEASCPKFLVLMQLGAGESSLWRGCCWSLKELFIPPRKEKGSEWLIIFLLRILSIPGNDGRFLVGSKVASEIARLETQPLVICLPASTLPPRVKLLMAPVSQLSSPDWTGLMDTEHWTGAVKNTKAWPAQNYPFESCVWSHNER